MLFFWRLGGNLIHPHPIRRLLSLKLIRNNLLAVKLYRAKPPVMEGSNRKGNEMGGGGMDLEHKRT